MDEMEKKEPEENAAKSSSTIDVAKDAAKNVAKSLAADAGRTYGALKEAAPGSFFSFEKLYFPSIARYAFIALCILAALVTLLGVLAGFAGIFTTGLFSGLKDIVMAIVTGAFIVVLGRFWFEFMLVGFKINDNVQELKDKMTKQ